MYTLLSLDNPDILLPKIDGLTENVIPKKEKVEDGNVGTRSATIQPSACGEVNCHGPKNGVDIKTASGMLWHFSACFTLDTYAHVTTTAEKEAVQTIGTVHGT